MAARKKDVESSELLGKRPARKRKDNGHRSFMLKTLIEDHEDFLKITARNSGSSNLGAINNETTNEKDSKAPLGSDTLLNDQKEKELSKWISFLAEKYGVTVEPINSDKEFYSKETLTRTIKENIYFLSKESPEVTAAVTGYLIEYKKIKDALLLSEPNEMVHDTIDLRERTKLLLDIANAKRVEQTSSKSLELGQKIAEIEVEYKDSHGGKNPSLNKIAEILNTRKILTPGGKTNWEAVTVKRIIDRNDRPK